MANTLKQKNKLTELTKEKIEIYRKGFGDGFVAALLRNKEIMEAEDDQDIVLAKKKILDILKEII